MILGFVTPMNPNCVSSGQHLRWVGSIPTRSNRGLNDKIKTSGIRMVRKINRDHRA